MKVTVEIHRDEKGRPSVLKVKKGRKKFQAEVTATDITGHASKIALTGARGSLPNFGELLHFFDGKHLARINTIELINLITLISEIMVIKNIETIGNMPNITPHGNDGVAFAQVAGAGAAWTTPTSANDPDGDWKNEANAYDSDTGTYAQMHPPPHGGMWGGFLELILASAVRANKIRFYIGGNFTDSIDRKVDVDVYKDGAWINVDEITEFDKQTWYERSFSEGSVEKARLRFWMGETEYVAYVYECDIYKVATSGGELIVQPEQSDATKLKAIVTQANEPLGVTPLIRLITLTNANIEYYQALSANTKKFRCQCRDATDFRLGFATGVGTTYFTVKSGTVYIEDHVNPSSLTLFLQCASAGKIIEIVEWT